MKKLIFTTGALLLVLIMSGCPTAPPEEIAVTGLELDATEATLLKTVALPAANSGTSTEQLTATITPANADNTNLSWSSDNENVVTVDETGSISAVSPGTAVVTAISEDGGFTAECSVTVLSRLRLDGSIEKTFQPPNTVTASYTHASGRNYNLVDEKNHSVELASDSNDDAVLALSYRHPEDSMLYTTTEYNPDLSYSDDSVKLLAAVVLPSDGTANDAIMYLDTSVDPKEYYTYMYSTGPVTISGSYTNMATITYSDVVLASGWNIIKVENNMAGTVTLKNGDIADPVWCYFEDGV